MKLLIDIEKALNEARCYVESCFIKVCNSETSFYWAFPHFKGKNRATECGGTSSALSVLKILTPSCTDIDSKVASALKWLYGRQSKHGSWESTGLHCSEVTARILCDIKEYNPPSSSVDKAIGYIKRCYNSRGYFSSTPVNGDEPHIYTTYICLKALKEYNIDISKYISQIKNWIIDSISADKHWGSLPKHNYGTVAHTVFSLCILAYCSKSFDTIKKDYKDKINWLRTQIPNIESKYDEDEIRVENGYDDLGTTYLTLKTVHNCSALLGELFLDLNYRYLSTIIIKKIISSQRLGGWGPDKDKTTMWAIEYNVELLVRFRTLFLKMPHCLKLLCSVSGLKSQILLCSLGIFLFLGTLIWICIDSSRFEDALLAFVTSSVLMLIPWLWKRNS